MSLDRDVAVEAELRTSSARLVAVFFLLALGYVLGQAAGYALFVERFGAADLPVALLLMPVVGVLLTTISLRAGRRLGLSRLVLLQVTAMVAVSAGVRFGLVGAGSSVLRFLLPMWDAGINNLSNLVVWTTASRLFDVRQAKRLAPIIASGRSAALVVGGASMPFVVGAVGTRNLYAVQAAVFTAALVVLATLVRRRHPDLDRVTPRRSGDLHRRGFDPSDRRYVSGVFASVLLSMTTYVLVRTVFLDRGAAALPDPADYAGRIGVVSALHGAVTLIGGLLLGARFLRRFGVLGGAVALPVVALGAYVPFVVWGPSLDTQLTIASVAYICASAAMYGVRTPTIQVLYQPLPDDARARAVSIGEGIVEPTGLGLAALILLLVGHATSWEATGMGVAVVFVAVALIGVGIGVARQYGPALERALANRWLRRDTAVLADGDSRRWLLEEAMRGDLDDVAVIVGLLDPLDDETARLVERLAGHSDTEVRGFALQWLLDAGRPPPTDVVRRLAVDDPSPSVRALAAHLGGRGGDIAGARVALADDDAAVRVAALVGMLESDVAAPLADERLAEWATGAQPFRTAAVTVLRVAGAARHESMVAHLLSDPDKAVRAGAIEAARRVAHPALVDPLIAVVSSGGASQASLAVAALAAIGEPALAALDASVDQSDDPSVRRQLARAIGRIEGPAGDASRRRLLEDRDPEIRARAADDLFERGVRLDSGDVDALVVAEVDRADAIVDARFDEPRAGTATSAPRALWLMSLDDSLAATRRRLLRLLSLDRRTIVSPNVIDGLDSPDPRRRAYALEALDRSMPGSLAPLVMPFLKPAALSATRDGRRRLSTGSNGEPPIDPLSVIAAGTDPWLAHIARHLIQPPHDSTSERDGEPMASLIERVVLLRRVDAFAELPTELLASVAELLVEVELADGATLFDEGDLGTSMYVVADGWIRIHHGSTDVDRLGRHDVFGELALLDSEPRSATVTADGPCRLLRLDAEPFFELVGEHPEVYRGILRKLVRRVRALTLMLDTRPT